MKATLFFILLYILSPSGSYAAPRINVENSGIQFNDLKIYPDKITVRLEDGKVIPSWTIQHYNISSALTSYLASEVVGKLQGVPPATNVPDNLCHLKITVENEDTGKLTITFPKVLGYNHKEPLEFYFTYLTHSEQPGTYVNFSFYKNAIGSGEASEYFSLALFEDYASLGDQNHGSTMLETHGCQSFHYIDE